MLNVYTGTLVLALHLLPAVLLWATWRLPQAAAGSKIVLGQVLGSVGFLLLFPLVEQLSWGAGPWARCGSRRSGKKYNEIMTKQEAWPRAMPP